MPLVGAAAWVGALAGLGWPRSGPGALAAAALGGALALLVVAARRRERHRRRAALGVGSRLLAAVLLVAVVTGYAAALRVQRVSDNPVASLAAVRAAVELELVVTSDPRPVAGRFADQWVVRARVERVASRAAAYDVRLPVVVLTTDDWSAVRLGERVAVSGRLAPSEDRDTAALLRPFVPATGLEPPAVWWDAAGSVRASLRRSVDGVPADRRPLVPALVVGDDQGLDRGLADDFRTTGLTHLLAVSGTNLTLLLGFVLILARGLGVRARGLLVVGGLGVVGFVLLARPEPSVLRAAVMGSVALVGLGSGGSRRGGRSLGVAVAGLLLLDPWLAPTPGFALSVLATAGIVFLAPVWRDALAGWLPRWVAEAVVGAGSGPAGVHPGGGGALRAGEPGGGRGQPARRPGGGTGHRPGSRRWARRPGLAAGRWARRLRRGLVRGLDRGRRPARRRAAGAGLRVGHRPACPRPALPRMSGAGADRSRAAAPAGRVAHVLRAARAGDDRAAAEPRLAARGLAAGGVRRGAGRRARAARRAGQRRGGGRRPRPGAGRRMPAPARRRPGAAGGADPLPCRPRRRPGRRGAWAPRRGGRGDRPGRPSGGRGRGGRAGPAVGGSGDRGRLRPQHLHRRGHPPGAVAHAGPAHPGPRRREHGQQRERGAAGRGARRAHAAHRRPGAAGSGGPR